MATSSSPDRAPFAAASASRTDGSRRWRTTSRRVTATSTSPPPVVWCFLVASTSALPPRDLQAIELDAASERSSLVGGATSVLSYFRTGSTNSTRPARIGEIFPEVLDARAGGRDRLRLPPRDHDVPADREIDWLVSEPGVTSFKYYMFYKGSTSPPNDRRRERTRWARIRLRSSLLDDGGDRRRGSEIRQVRLSLSIHCESAELIESSSTACATRSSREAEDVQRGASAAHGTAVDSRGRDIADASGTREPAPSLQRRRCAPRVRCARCIPTSTFAPRRRCIICASRTACSRARGSAAR